MSNSEHLERPQVIRDTALNVHVLDSGGRGHATVRELLASDRVVTVTTSISAAVDDPEGHKVRLFRHDSKNAIAQTIDMAQELQPDLVFVGPEDPLIGGVVDQLHALDIPAIGPRQELTWLEGDKGDARLFMKKYGIPGPEFSVHDNLASARRYVQSRREPLVVKATGPAGGKGSIVCDDQSQALSALDAHMVERRFGDSGDKVVVEDRLFGIEQSVTILTDGQTAIFAPPARDYPHRFDANQGPITGGMGSHSPSGNENMFDPRKVQDMVVTPLLEGLRAEFGSQFVGVLYPGLMWVEENGVWNPKVLEINIRPGDPEWEVIAPRYRGDWAELMIAINNGRLNEIVKPDMWSNTAYVGVCAVSGAVPSGETGGKGQYKGYPWRYKTGQTATLQQFPSSQGHIIHNGTHRVGDGEYQVTGGRVLTAVGKGQNLAEAGQNAYQIYDNDIAFDYKDARRDIADSM